MAPNTITLPQAARPDLIAALWRLGPSMGRVIAETAGAFLATDAVPGPDWALLSRLPDLGVLHCSQKNVGEKHEMICNLSVDKSEWRRLLGSSGGEEFSLDAFCEMANCICGSLIADPRFTDEFGYLIPCVPYAGHCRARAGSLSSRGAFRLGGAWVHYSISIQAAANAVSRENMLAA